MRNHLVLDDSVQSEYMMEHAPELIRIFTFYLDLDVQSLDCLDQLFSNNRHFLIKEDRHLIDSVIDKYIDLIVSTDEDSHVVRAKKPENLKRKTRESTNLN